MFRRHTLAAFLLTVIAVPALAAPPAGELTPAGHTTDSLDDVKAHLAAGRAVLLDVREPREWDAGHLDVAKPLPLSILKKRAGDHSFARFLHMNLSPELIVYTHCRRGRRCLTAAEPLRAFGYEVRPLKAGYSELKSAGFGRIDVRPTGAE